MTKNDNATEATSLGLTFGTPPETREVRDRIDWQGIADQLYSNPGQWARVDVPIGYSTARTRASQVRRGLARGFEEGTWDARTEKAGEKEAYVWLICESPDSSEASDDEVPFA